MTFLAPLFFTALVAVSIPVIIHLLNLKKPKEIQFSTLAFFSLLQQSTLKRLKLKRWLLLAVRIAAICALVLALTRPVMQLEGIQTASGAPVVYGLLLDNSPGMMRIDQSGPFFDQVLEIANAIVEQANDNDRFLIYTTHGELIQSGFTTDTGAIQILNQLKPLDKGDQTFKRLSVMQQMIAEDLNPNKVIFWISDGRTQRLETGIKSYSSEYSEIPVQFVQIGNQTTLNTAVSGFRVAEAMNRRGQPVTVEVLVTNFGNDDLANHYISAEVGGSLIGQYQADILGGDTQSFLFDLPADKEEIAGKILLEGDTYTIDNEWNFSLRLPRERNILLIRPNGSNFIESVLMAGADLSSSLIITTNTLSEFLNNSSQSFDAYILDGLPLIPADLTEILADRVQQGAGLVLYPSEKGDTDSYNRLLSALEAGSFVGMRGSFGRFEPVTVLAPIVEGHPVLDEIFDKPADDPVRIQNPSFFYFLRYSSPSQNPGQIILQTATNDVILTEHKPGNGKVLISTIGSGPGWSNLPAHPLFAPLMYRIALYASSANNIKFQFHNLGTPFAMSFPLENLRVQIEHDQITYRPETGYDLRGEVAIRYPGVEWLPGRYTLRDDNTTFSIAVNQHIMESDFQTLSRDEIKELLGNQMNINNVIEKGDESISMFQNRVLLSSFGSEIWHWFLWIGFILFITESLISRFYKVESIG